VAVYTTKDVARSSSTYLFQQISKRGAAQGLIPGSEEARDWFRDSASSFKRVDSQRLMQNKKRLFNTIAEADLGRMYMFFYDPKHKETLPYYDKFPLIFIVEKYNDGFLGINLHYLPHTYRARLMDALYDIERDDRLRADKKLKLTYGVLKTASRFKYFKPCVKRYLYSHVRSRFLYVPYEEWDISLMLPTERFSKKGKAKVWEDSKRIIRDQ
jgi:hypothetical protein